MPRLSPLRTTHSQINSTSVGVSNFWFDRRSLQLPKFVRNDPHQVQIRLVQGFSLDLSLRL